MKRKILLSFLVVFLILSLIGCMPIAPGVPAWTRAEQVVFDYWRAIINREYKLAKWYCIPDGVWYNKTDEWEEYINVNSEGEASVIISEPTFHKETEVIGVDTSNPLAITYVKIHTNKRPSLDSIITYSDDFEYEIELAYQSGNWKLK